MKHGPPDAPYQLGRYVVVSELGRGGMASVHLARADGPGGFLRWCAIKQVHPTLVENSDVVDMFLDEARMAARINHPNVAQIYELGRNEETYWLVMEYLHGEPLRELVRHQETLGAPLPWHIAARIVSEAAEGLHAAHEARDESGRPLGLVHRDVTPHNIFITYDGQVKLVDFGIAKAEGRLAHTGYGMIKGKLAYMSPEQAWERDIDRRTDVYALGIVLWELLTNRRLFAKETDVDSFIAVREAQVPKPTDLVPGIPPKLEKIALRALYRSRDRRYQTAREFSRALQIFIRKTFGTVGSDEVASYVRDIFADREAERKVELEIAAELSAQVRPSALLEGAEGTGTVRTTLEEGSWLFTRDGSEVDLSARPTDPRASNTDETEVATRVMTSPFDWAAVARRASLPFSRSDEPRVVLRDPILDAPIASQKRRTEQAVSTVRKPAALSPRAPELSRRAVRIAVLFAALGLAALGAALWLAADAFR